MQGRGSANIPRSSSENRKSDLSDADDRSREGSGVSGGFRHKFSGFCGFVGSITAVIAAVILIMWAYVPDYWLNSMGIYFYTNRLWALVTPTYVMATIVVAIGCYTGLSLMATPPPTSLKSILDECSNELVKDILSTYDDEQAVEPVSDIGGNQFDDNVS